MWSWEFYVCIIYQLTYKDLALQQGVNGGLLEDVSFWLRATIRPLELMRRLDTVTHFRLQVYERACAYKTSETQSRKGSTAPDGTETTPAVITGPSKPFPGFMKDYRALITAAACPCGDAESIHIIVNAYKRAKRLKNEQVLVIFLGHQQVGK